MGVADFKVLGLPEAYIVIYFSLLFHSSSNMYRLLCCAVFIFVLGKLIVINFNFVYSMMAIMFSVRS